MPLIPVSFSTDSVNDLAGGTPKADDLVTYSEVTPPVSRVVRGTATAIGTATKYVRVKDSNGNILLTGTVGTDIAAGASATAFATNVRNWLNTNKASFDSTASIVDNSNGTFDSSLTAGALGNNLVFETNDTHLSFAQTVLGVDTIYILKNCTLTVFANAINSILNP